MNNTALQKEEFEGSSGTSQIDEGDLE